MIVYKEYNVQNKLCCRDYSQAVKNYLRKDPKSFYDFVNRQRKINYYPSSMKVNNVESADNSEIAIFIITDIIANMNASIIKSKIIKDLNML